jgi:hypothetical protein
MIESTQCQEGEQLGSPERRKLLRLLVITSAALSCIVLTGCEGSIPPRQVKRIPSHIVGSGRMGGGGK